MPFIRSIRSLAAALIVFLAACAAVEDAVQPVRAEAATDPFELIVTLWRVQTPGWQVTH